ncbi:MAG: hypothetical protein ABIS47_08740, partial [Acidimicrobiales bacterium]
PEQAVDAQIDADVPATPPTPDGVPDLLTFRIDGFVAGDYLKVRLRGSTSAASFSGLLFDTSDPLAAPPVAAGPSVCGGAAPVVPEAPAWPALLLLGSGAIVAVTVVRARGRRVRRPS